jgi:hypothetical protein
MTGEKEGPEVVKLPRVAATLVLGVAVHDSNPGTQRLRQENENFKASLGCIARTCLKN